MCIAEMKTVFKIAMAWALPGCIDLGAAPLGESSGGSDGDATDASASSANPTTPATDGPCVGCGDDGHGLTGDLLLFVNGRLTSADALYQSNIPAATDGHYVGSAIYLYDPDAACDDGTDDCRLALLGNARFDEALGETSVGDGSLKKMSLRELAWSPTQGLWGITYDVANDEWGIASIDVPDWRAVGQDLGVERYALLPGDPQSPGTDPCYWQEVVSGLGFLGEDLLLGVRGVGGVGIANDGLLYRIDLEVIRDRGWCVYENDPSQDPQYYACDVLCQPWADFGPAIGVAGDIAADADGEAALAVVRAEDAMIMPLDRQELWKAMPPVDGPSTPTTTGLYAEPVPPGLDLEGLARVDGALFGIDVTAQVWRLDEATGEVAVHEALAARFDDAEQALRIRGATHVVIEP